MFEFGTRLVMGLGIAIVAAMTKQVPIDYAVKLAIWIATYGYLAFSLARRKIMNAGIAGFFACLDALSIALIIGSATELHRFGFLVLAPIAFTATRYGTSPAAMAPIAAAALLVAHQVWVKTSPQASFYIQVLGVLLIGLALNHRRIFVTVTRDVIGKIEPLQGAEPEGFLELRENFRQLKDAYGELEQRSRRDALAVQLMQAQLPNGNRFLDRLAGKLREMVQADGISIYRPAEFDGVLVNMANHGEISPTLQDAAMPIDLIGTLEHIESNFDQAASALLSEEARAEHSFIACSHQGRIAAVVVVRTSDSAERDICAENIRSISHWIGFLVGSEEQRFQNERRLREMELLYLGSSISQGAETSNTLAARISQHLGTILQIDHLGIYWLEGEHLIPSVSSGPRHHVFDILSFGMGPGIEGWLALGAPEVHIHQTTRDSRCRQQDALRQRIGSIAILPLQFGPEPYGVLIATTHRAGGIDVPELEILRTVSGEFSRGLGVIHGSYQGVEGMVTSAEFSAQVQHNSGVIATIELLRREALVSRFGEPAYDHAVRQLALRIKARLPKGGLICRRPDGDLLAFLTGFPLAEAQLWANELAASASMIGIRTPDGRERVPLAIRVRVAPIESEVTRA